MAKFEFQDHFFRRAKEQGFVARSAFKLEEIDKKFGIFDGGVRRVLDVGCAPGSRMQRAAQRLDKIHRGGDFKILGVDVKPMAIADEKIRATTQDITDFVAMKKLIEEQLGGKIDLIQSDMAPNTTGVKDADALRLFGLLDSLWEIFEEFFDENSKFVLKVFMGPGFEEWVAAARKKFGAKRVKIFKPTASREASKETYLVLV